MNVCLFFAAMLVRNHIRNAFFAVFYLSFWDFAIMTVAVFAVRLLFARS